MVRQKKLAFFADIFRGCTPPLLRALTLLRYAPLVILRRIPRLHSDLESDDEASSQQAIGASGDLASEMEMCSEALSRDAWSYVGEPVKVGGLHIEYI